MFKSEILLSLINLFKLFKLIPLAIERDSTELKQLLFSSKKLLNLAISILSLDSQLQQTSLLDMKKQPQRAHLLNSIIQNYLHISSKVFCHKFLYIKINSNNIKIFYHKLQKKQVKKCNLYNKNNSRK